MQITYYPNLFPFIECTAFLERYVNHYDYTDLKSYSNTESHIEMLKLCNQIKEEMGQQLELCSSQCKLLFTQLPKHNSSVMKTLVLECLDAQLPTWEAQLSDIKQKVIRHENLLLCCVLAICDEEKAESRMAYETASLYEQLNACELPDAMKWQFFRMNAQAKELLEQVEQLYHLVMPIYYRYEARLNDYAAVYQKDHRQYQDALYDRFVQKSGISFASQQKTVLIPTLAYCFSIMITDHFFFEAKHNYILWGVYILHINPVQQSSMETLCSVLKTLSDKSKFEILCFISKNQKAYGAQIAKAMKLTTATISYHMQALIDAGLVTVEKLNNRLYFQVHEEHLQEYLKQIEQKILHP